MAKDPGIGKLITEPNPQRDAIHVAVAPVVAAHNLNPGTHVSLDENGRAVMDGLCLGIVDPFLKGTVLAGERFWLFLYPGTITTLRHHWEHPAFVEPAEPAVDKVAESHKWLDEFASTFARSYYDATEEPRERSIITGDELLNAMKDVVHGRGWGRITLNYDTPERAYTWAPEMWRHYEIITGEKVPAETKKESVFSCAC
jgi:hypothetical protein